MFYIWGDNKWFFFVGYFIRKGDLWCNSDIGMSNSYFLTAYVFANIPEITPKHRVENKQKASAVPCTSASRQVHLSLVAKTGLHLKKRQRNTSLLPSHLASASLKYLWSVFLWFLASQSCPVHICYVMCWEKHIMDPHIGTQICCPMEPPCTLSPCHIPGHRTDQLSCRGLDNSLLNYLFIFYAPFQDALWKLLIREQILVLNWCHWCEEDGIAKDKCSTGTELD